MVNEIHVSIWLVLLCIDIILILIAFLGTALANHINVICSVLGTTLTFILSHSILNGNVVMLDGDGIFSPIQSLPVFYFLEGLSVIMVIYTAFLIWQTLNDAFTTHSVFEGDSDL